jgi:diguanylate cyclase (GGDEF)-like protein
MLKMYSKIKHTIYSLLYFLLTARFFFLIWDPSQSRVPINPQDAFPLYESWRPLIDFIYTSSAFITYPFVIIGQAIPGIPKDLFPYMRASILAEQWQPVFQQVPFLNDWAHKAPEIVMPGFVDWTVPLVMVVLGVLSPALDSAYDFIRNLVWNIFIEFAYTKEKQQLYQDALRQRAEALMKLNVEYRNLSYEANQLKDSVVTDELTSLYNKRFFIENIKVEFETARDQKKNLSLIMMDIDHFKKVNDTHGHLVGDHVLKKVAHIAKNATPGKCFACRFGGEEFCVIMPDKGLEEALAVANTIRDNVPILRFDEVPDLRATISLDVSTVNFNAPDAALLKQFDDFVKLAERLYRLVTIASAGKGTDVRGRVFVLMLLQRVDAITCYRF